MVYDCNDDNGFILQRGIDMTDRRKRRLQYRREKNGKLSGGSKRRYHRGRKKPNKFMTWFKGLSKKKRMWFCIGAGALAVLLLVMAVLSAILIPKYMKMQDRIVDIDGEEIVINQEVEEAVGSGYTNFVLFAGDSRTGNLDKGVRSDGIIIASLNNETKEIKLVSVYRDTLLDIGDGNFQKCNAAYSYGGPAQAISMLNRNLDLNIKKFVTVDFSAVSEVIDLLGGISVDVSEAERIATNKYIGETARVAGKKANYLTKSGVQTLDGVQATTYARIRKGVGDDYQRTERQRIIIEKTMEKAKKADLTTLNKIADKVIDMVYTNFKMKEILSYMKDITKYQIGETTGFPIDKTSKTLSYKGSCVIPVTLEDNVSQLHKLLFNKEDYQPSSTVVSLSNQIISMVGNQTADPHTSYNPDAYDVPDEDKDKDPDKKPNKDPDTGNTDKPVDTHTHVWSPTWTGSTTHHWHECTNPGCTVTDITQKDGYGAHSGGTATCVGMRCTVCNMLYGTKDTSNHTGETEVRNAKEATATTDGYTGDTYCKGCGVQLSTGTVIPATGSGSGTDDGSGSGTDTGDGSGSGTGTGDGSGSGTGDGSGSGTGTGDGSGSGTETGDGSGTP